MKIKNKELAEIDYCLSVSNNVKGIDASKILSLIELSEEVSEKFETFKKANTSILKSAGVDLSLKDFSKDEKFDSIKDKLDELANEETELKKVKFLSGEDLVKITEGQNISVIKLLKKYLVA